MYKIYGIPDGKFNEKYKTIKSYIDKAFENHFEPTDEFAHVYKEKRIEGIHINMETVTSEIIDMFGDFHDYIILNDSAIELLEGVDTAMNPIGSIEPNMIPSKHSTLFDLLYYEKLR